DADQGDRGGELGPGDVLHERVVALEGDLVDGPHHAGRDGDVDSPAAEGEKQRLEDELAHDVNFPCADRELDADLAGPFLHHDVHDLGDTDPGDDESKRPHEVEEDLDAEADAAVFFFVLDEIPHAERAFVRRGELVAAAEHAVEVLFDGGGG